MTGLIIFLPCFQQALLKAWRMGWNDVSGAVPTKIREATNSFVADIVQVCPDNSARSST